MEDLLKEAFEAGKDLGHAMGTGKPTYGLNFKEWYEGKALRIHDVVGRSEQVGCDNCADWKQCDDPDKYCLVCNRMVEL